MSEEKTEKPTEQKNKENRKEGQVPRSQEFGGWGSLLAFAMALPLLLGHELGALQELMVAGLSAAGDPDVSLGLETLRDGLTHIAVVLVALGSAVLLIGVAAALAQGGFFVASKAAKPKFSKISPLKGFKRIFSAHTLWEGAKMLLKTAVLGVLAYGIVDSLLALVGGLVPLDTVLEEVRKEAYTLIRNVAAAALVLGALDYLFQRKKMGKQTRMTKQEVKQEHKNSEGDPLIRSAIRARQMAASRNRMMADVPTADVVLVNPTHVAVALRYEADKGAPRVVARGAGAIAARIRESAEENRVPIVQDIPLARALHSSTQVGQEIPAELFAAVAQVLAFVISRRTRGAVGGQHRSPRADLALPEVPRSRRRVRTAQDASAGADQVTGRQDGVAGATEGAPPSTP
ncbi:EscU/YscU/HrcU family type III secretion system export apparatus switch protein [Nocardioides yefusunii]|uniref:Flagellar biosynthesis protein FlhB n=1 Tax=Nocardioides yefusunii TaxID=2500546 RepID=A0ABW1QYH6_9ACTN|nr:EscU/YscU/HrcU family type III secretion system export apparatus switch protein [Nocardioides yefusunii]